MKRSKSFSTRLSLSIILTTTVLFMTCMIAVGITSIVLMGEEASNSARHTLKSTISEIETIMTGVQTAVNNMSWVVKEHLDDPDYMFDITQQIVQNNPNIIGCAVAFEPSFYPKKGKYFAPYSYIDEGSGTSGTFQMGSDDYDYFAMDWYQTCQLMGEEQWCEPYFDDGGGDQMMITYSMPIFDESGNVIAVLTADISLNVLTDRVVSIPTYEDSYTFIISRSGSFISHPQKDLILNKTIFAFARDNRNKALEEMGERMVKLEEGQGKIRIEGLKSSIVFYAPIMNGWSVGLACPYVDIFEKTNRAMLIFFIVSILGLVVLFLVDRRMIYRLTLPITEFAYSAQSIGKGYFNARIPEVKTDDELKRLQESLAYMEKSIQSYIKELRSTTASNEKFESELTIANGIQMGMLKTAFPVDERFDLYANLHPAKEVGGDLYDFVIRGDKAFVVVGDVSGKGVPAALYMSITLAALRFISGLGFSIDKVMSSVNDAISDGNTMGMFVTTFIAVIDLNTLEVQYCNGGHNPIIVIDPDGSARYLSAIPNLPIGLFEGFGYKGESMKLSKGSRLVIYTDGVSEAENRAKDLYGEERLLNYCNSCSVDMKSEDFISGLIKDVKGFTKDNPQNDDMTMMSIKFN